MPTQARLQCVRERRAAGSPDASEIRPTEESCYIFRPPTSHTAAGKGAG